ncbi:hypothetical protein ACH5AO_19985 [Streptomyces sp. NPDC018964]|uniref:hypothetical protein n=1 Tax=unclassified Streptomyces TaxID=2593676 RepID=UPI00378C661E
MISELLTRGILEIRLSARSGVAVTTDDPAQADRLGEIHLIADICHGFVNALGGSVFTRERRSRHALSWRWSMLDESGRRWIRSRLEDLGPEYLRVLDSCVGDEPLV